MELGIIAFPPRLKPDLFWTTYGATEVAPFQDEDSFNKLLARTNLRLVYSEAPTEIPAG